MDHIALDSPVVTMDRNDAQKYYFAMGPPYIATARDMFSIVTNVSLSPRFTIITPSLAGRNVWRHPELLRLLHAKILQTRMFGKYTRARDSILASAT
jgi:hypothetical protein